MARADLTATTKTSSRKVTKPQARKTLFGFPLPPRGGRGELMKVSWRFLCAFVARSLRGLSIDLGFEAEELRARLLPGFPGERRPCGCLLEEGLAVPAPLRRDLGQEQARTRALLQ